MDEERGTDRQTGERESYGQRENYGEREKKSITRSAMRITAEGEEIEMFN